VAFAIGYSRRASHRQNIPHARRQPTMRGRNARCRKPSHNTRAQSNSTAGGCAIFASSHQPSFSINSRFLENTRKKRGRLRLESRLQLPPISPYGRVVYLRDSTSFWRLRSTPNVGCISRRTYVLLWPTFVLASPPRYPINSPFSRTRRHASMIL
jgi:hypothetical protein